jgi:hypothetical protein
VAPDEQEWLEEVRRMMRRQAVHVAIGPNHVFYLSVKWMFNVS